MKVTTMPEVEYRDKEGKVRRQRMFTPKRIQEISHWIKEARKSIPTIPDPSKSDWRVIETTIETKWITIHFANSVNERARIIIDRQKPAF